MNTYIILLFCTSVSGGSSVLCIFNSLSSHPIYHACLRVMLFCVCVCVCVRVRKRAIFNDECDIGELFVQKNPFCAGLIYKRPM